jgi:drug/metabolite transporter (DMT)-like permease
VALLLGLLVAVTYGSGDFCGGQAMRRAPVGATLLWTQAIGLAALLLVAPFAGGSPSAGDLALGAVAGLAGAAGIGCLYRGLSIGRASVVAPVSAVGAAILQVAWGLARGEDPGAVALTGVALSLVAVGIVAGSAGETTEHSAGRRTELLFGTAAAVLLGVFIILFSETGSDSGLWPAVTARLAPIPVLLVGLALLRRPILVGRAARGVVAGAGVLDATANALLLVALREGLLSIVAPVAALYPASTVVLSRIVLHERLGRARLAGLAVALVGLVLIGAS